MPRESNDDFAMFNVIGHSIIYKGNESQGLRTFMQCKFNYIEVQEGEENTNDDIPKRLDNRHCYRCNDTDLIGISKDADKCISCSDLGEYVANADPFEQYYFVESCDGTSECVDSGFCPYVEEETA